jgi:hypothetical protein
MFMLRSNPATRPTPDATPFPLVQAMRRIQFID